MGDLSEHFSRTEMRCKHCNLVKVDPELILILESLRNKCGQPIHISSGFRCKKHNAAVGGAKDSMHLYGKAADIQVEGITPAIVASMAETVKDIGGIGTYKTWVHVDCGPKGRRWKG